MGETLALPSDVFISIDFSMPNLIGDSFYFEVLLKKDKRKNTGKD